jgi:type I restriction enzyme S subunit
VNGGTQLVSLGQVVELVMGQAPPSKDCNFESIGTPFVKVGEFGESRPLIREWTTKPLRMARKSDVLLCVVGATCGKINLGEDCAIGRSVAAIRPDATKLDQYYLHYFMMTLVERLRTGSVGAAQTVISKEMISNVEAPIPQLPEQHRIVAILDEALDGIATARANAEKNLQNARALFVTAFGSMASASEQGPWNETTVKAIAAPKKNSIRTGPFGSQLLHSEFVDEGIAVLGIDNAVANEFRWGKSRFITADKYQQLERYKVYPGDVLITIMGTCGRCAVVPDDIPVAINTKHLCCITTDGSKCLPGYLHAYFLYHPIARDFLAKKAKGSIMAGLNMGLIQELPLLLPSVERQREIVERLDLLREEVQRLETIYLQKITALDDLKKSLLHQAFTGQL